MKMEGAMVVRMMWLLLILAAPVTLAWAQQSAPKPELVVARPVVNMFAKASADSEVVSQALYGAGAHALRASSGWVEIRTADDYTGWVRSEELLAGVVPYAPEGKAIRVAQLSANVYREPDVTKHAPVLNLPWESRLEVLPDKIGSGERWLKVKLVTGELAYVQKGDVSTEFKPLTIDESLQVARRFLGVTYTWGGTSSYGFDCSGFTQMIVRQRGIIMPRDADVQANWSGVAPVKREELAPGDLLFFGVSADKITHTGMYIGNGEFIHDTTHEHAMVQISKLDDMPWTKLLVAARRVKQ